MDTIDFPFNTLSTVDVNTQNRYGSVRVTFFQLVFLIVGGNAILDMNHNKSFTNQFKRLNAYKT